MKKIRITEQEKKDLKKEINEIIEKALDSSEISAITIKPKDLNEKLLDKSKVVKPEIYIPVNVLEKMFALVDESSVEIQWHGLVKRKENKYWIYDILMFPQKNSAARTDTDDDKYADWLTNIMQDENPDKFDDLRMHGHSHVNMQVYSSSIDDTYQEQILANLKENDFYIFMVMNKKREVCTLLYDYVQNILFETADIEIYKTTGKEILKTWAEAQIKEYCEKPTYTYQGYVYPGRSPRIYNTPPKESKIKNKKKPSTRKEIEEIYSGLDFDDYYYSQPY